MRRLGQEAVNGQDTRTAIQALEYPLWPLKPDTLFFQRVAAHIDIRPSRVPNAGQGAFSRIDLPANRLIGVYRGERLTKQQFDARYPDGFGEYVLRLKPNLYVDAKNVNIFSKMINDARGSLKPPNIVFTHQGALKTCLRVRKGDELLVDYGRSYFA